MSDKKRTAKKIFTIEDKGVLDVSQAGIELIDTDEIFVRVKNTKNYWISNV